MGLQKGDEKHELKTLLILQGVRAHVKSCEPEKKNDSNI